MSESITVGGLPGTGTSTLCTILQRRTGLPYVYAGQIFREEAARRGMDLADFGRLCEKDPSVDRALDARQLELLRQGPLILEGRLSGHIAHRNGVPALKVWLECEGQERIRRVVERDGGDVADQEHRVHERERSEALRYRLHYGIDLGDTAVHDLVLDSTRSSPEQLADAVLAAWGSRPSAGTV